MRKTFYHPDSLQITLYYLAVSVLWIWLSDGVVEWLADKISPKKVFWLQSWKGTFFVSLSALFIFFYTSRIFKRLENVSQQYKTLFQQNPMPMWVFNKKSLQILDANTAAVQKFSYTYDEMLNLTIKDIRPQEEVPEFLNSLTKIDFEFNKTKTWRYLTKRQEFFLAEVLAYPIQFDNNEAFLVLANDITEKKKAEERNAQLTDELIRQNNELKQFAYITSHNLRAPVVNILALIEIFNREDPADPFNLQALDNVKAAALRLDETLKDLNLALENANDLSIVKQKESFDLRELIQAVLLDFSAAIHETQTEALIDIKNFKTIFTVKSYWHSILHNLISNAVKYRDPNRLLVIMVRAERVGDVLHLEIRDNGKGFDWNQNKDKIFGFRQRFHRGVEGRGLGLYMTRTQIEAMGGTIEVSSRPNEGAYFFIKLPNAFNHEND